MCAVIPSPSFTKISLVHLDIFQRIDLAAGPANLKRVDFLGLSQAKVDSQIVLREVSAAAADFVDLLMRLRFSGRVRHAHQARADSAAIRFRSNGANLDPVVVELRIATEQLRIVVDRIDHDIDVSVIIEIAKGRAARGARL